MNKFLKLSLFSFLILYSTQVISAEHPINQSPEKHHISPAQSHNITNKEKVAPLQGYGSTAKIFVSVSEKTGKFSGAVVVGFMTYAIVTPIAVTLAEALSPYALECLDSQTCLINPILEKLVTTNFVVEASSSIRFALSTGVSVLGFDAWGGKFGAYLGHKISKATVDGVSYTSTKAVQGLKTGSSFLLRKTTEGASYLGQGLLCGLKLGSEMLFNTTF